MRWRPASAALLLFAATCAPPSPRPAAARQHEPFGRYSREVDVPAAGWVRVLLPPDDLARCGPDGGGVRVFDAAGPEVPSAAGPYRLPVLTVQDSRRLPAPAVAQGSAECWTESTYMVCRPSVPGMGQVPVRLDLDPSANLGDGFRLYGAAGREVPSMMSPGLPPGSWIPSMMRVGSLEGSWILLAEGAWQPGKRGRIDLPAPRGSLIPVDGLRLELYGLPLRLPSLRYRLELAPVSVLFLAPGAGRYVLAFGATTAYQGYAAPDIAAQANARLLQPGPRRAQRPPPLPARTTGPAQLLDEAGFGSSWRVEARGALAGDVVHVEIPDRLYARSSTLADLRLAADGRELPYLLWQRGEPVRVAESDGLTLDPRNPKSASVALPFSNLPLSSALITTHPAVAVYLSLSGEHGQGAALDASRCDSQPPLPCRRMMNLQGSFGAGAPRSLYLQATGGSSAGARFDVSLWRRRDALVFVWPAAADVRLVANNPALGAPSYDLQAVSAELAARSWKPAVLGSETAPHWPAWRPLALLALIAALLFAALVRLSSALAP